MCVTSESKFEGKNIYIVETKSDLKDILCDNIRISNGLVTIDYPRFVNMETYCDIPPLKKIDTKNRYVYSRYIWDLDYTIKDRPIIKYLHTEDSISFNQSDIKLINTVSNFSFDDFDNINFKHSELKYLCLTKEDAIKKAKQEMIDYNNNVIKHNKEFFEGNEESREWALAKYEHETKSSIEKFNKSRFYIFGIYFTEKKEYTPISFANHELDSMYRKDILEFYERNNIKYK